MVLLAIPASLEADEFLVSDSFLVDEAFANDSSDADPGLLPGAWCATVDLPATLTFNTAAVEWEKFYIDGCIICNTGEWREDSNDWVEAVINPLWPASCDLMSDRLLNFVVPSRHPSMKTSSSWPMRPNLLQMSMMGFSSTILNLSMGCLPLRTSLQTDSADDVDAFLVHYHGLGCGNLPSDRKRICAQVLFGFSSNTSQVLSRIASPLSVSSTHLSADELDDNVECRPSSA
jgi:hypothetical protein